MIWDDLNHFIHYIQNERRYSAYTIRSYHTDLRQFIQYLEDHFFDNQVCSEHVDKKHIRGFVEDLFICGLNKRSIARKISAIKSFFKYLQRIRVLKSNPVISFRTPKLDKPLPRVLDESEIRKLLELPPEDSLEGIRDRAILELFYGCGIRLGELLKLKMKQIQLKNHYIIVEGKRNKDRVVPIGNYAIDALTKYIDIRKEISQLSKDSPYVFIDKKGKTLYPLKVQKMVKQYLNQVSEQDHLSPHVLRHTYATHLLDRGADLLAVKELLGHSSLSTTQIYTHVSMERLKKVYRKTHPRSGRDVSR